MSKQDKHLVKTLWYAIATLALTAACIGIGYGIDWLSI